MKCTASQCFTPSWWIAKKHSVISHALKDPSSLFVLTRWDIIFRYCCFALPSLCLYNLAQLNPQTAANVCRAEAVDNRAFRSLYLETFPVITGEVAVGWRPSASPPDLHALWMWMKAAQPTPSSALSARKFVEPRNGVCACRHCQSEPATERLHLDVLTPVPN